MSTFVLVLWALGAFSGLALGCFSATAVLKPAIRRRYEKKYGAAKIEDRGKTAPKTPERRRYISAVRSVPNLIGLVIGGAHWSLVLAGYEGAEHFRLWPAGLMPLAEPVLGLGAGGLSLVIHASVAATIPAFTRAMGTAVATKVGGQRIDVEKDGEPFEMASTMEFDAIPGALDTMSPEDQTRTEPTGFQLDRQDER